MLIAINMSDVEVKVKVNLKPYLYLGAKSVKRYHIVGLLSANETVDNNASETISIASGESVIWIFTAAKSRN